MRMSSAFNGKTPEIESTAVFTDAARVMVEVWQADGAKVVVWTVELPESAARRTTLRNYARMIAKQYARTGASSFRDGLLADGIGRSYL